MSIEKVQHPLQPIYNEKSRVLVLGTMPSPESRKKGFYYSHPQNRFWQVLSAVFDVPAPFTNAEKEKLVLDKGVALWDVLASCDIDGAEDSSIRNPVANDIASFLKETGIKQVFTTGDKAWKLYKKLCQPTTGIEAIKLPSTSPAARGKYPLNVLISEYMALREKVNIPELHSGIKGEKVFAD